MTNRTTRARRLEAAGYRCVPDQAWLPEAYWRKVVAQIEMHREDVERIAETPGKPGRPKKS